jgi:mannose-1-phosphate guanylyltransferase
LIVIVLSIGRIFFSKIYSIYDLVLYFIIGLLFLYHDYVFAQYRLKLQYNKILINNAILVLGYFAGVFVFRLGDMLDIVHQQFGASNYTDLYAHYSELPKLSFDRMVIEKEKDLAVVRYAGKWKDLGSWNSLLEETPVREMGNVMIGRDVVNTHIINELDQPLLCVGTHNMVVAATNDGILVSRKDISGTLKHNVDSLEVRPMYEERRWGSYKVISNLTFPDGARALTKLLCISAGKNISYQIHHHRDELWTFIDGEGELVIDNVQRTVRRGDIALIKAGQLHAVKATTDLKIIEVQSGTQLVEEDIERFDWKWE